MTSHHAKFQLDSSKRSSYPIAKKVKQQQRRRQQRHPPGLNYSPQRKVFHRGQKLADGCAKEDYACCFRLNRLWYVVKDTLGF